MDFYEHLERLHDGELSADEAAELNQTLRDDPAALREVIDAYLFEVAVRDEFALASAKSVARGARYRPREVFRVLASLPVRVVTAIPQALSGWLAPSRRAGQAPTFGFPQLLSAVAATFVFASASTAWLMMRGDSGVGWLAGADYTAEAKPSPSLARVAATRNCRWGGGLTGLGFGAEVAGNEIMQLEAGLAELSFPSGGRLVFEGPASFRISGRESVELFAGRVTASVPEGAEELSVRTSRLVVSGSGARYGVVAGGDGASEVHAFESGVEASLVGHRGKLATPVRLGAFEAARADREPQASLRRIEAVEDAFVRSLDIRTGPGHGLLAVESFEYVRGPLAMQNGGFGWGGSWTELEADPTQEVAEVFTNRIDRGSLTAVGAMGAGNRCVQSGHLNRIRRVLATNRGGVFDAAGCIEVVDGFPMVRNTGGSIYLSFLQRVSKTDDNFYGLELHRGDGRYNRVLCVGSAVDETGYGVSVSFEQPAGQAKFVPLGEENDKVNFIVVRIDYGEKERDRVVVYRNPESIGDESRCTAEATLEGIFGFDRISIANYHGEKVHEIDEVRVGTDFRAVTGGMPSSSSTEHEPGVAMSPFELCLPIALAIRGH